MGILNLLKKAVKMNDLFYATEMLRYDKELQYTSFTGGLLSLAIIIAVTVGFASMILDTLALTSITYTQVISKDQVPTSAQVNVGTGSKFMLAIELWGVNMSSIRYFDVLMIQLRTTSGQKAYNYSIIPLSACTRQHWADFPQIAARYDDLSMSSWLCPPLQTNLSLSGDFTSNIFQYVNISVNPCIDWLDSSSPCASPSELKQLFKNLSDAIRYNVYYTNPLINPDQKDYISYYLQSANYISFGSTIGGEGFLYFADYSIKTDNSIWPYPSLQAKNGILIQEKFIFHPYTTFLSTYASFYLVKSPTSYSYQRTVQKISNIFSFIGGLISAISTSLFILKIYNNLAFQISLALCIFQPTSENQVNSSNINMNLFTFFKFQLYKFLNKIGKTPSWPQTSFLIDCQQQIVKQLDIKAFVKRIIFLEYCMVSLFEDYQLEGLQIQKPKTPKDISKIRQKCESLDTFHECHFDESQSNQSERQQQKSDIDIQRNKILNKLGLKGQQETPSQIIGKVTSLNSGSLSLKRQIKKSQGQAVIDLNGNNNFNKGNKVVNQRKNSQDRKQKNLLILEKNAEQGDRLSKRIWNQIDASKLNSVKYKHRNGYIFKKE